MKPLLYFFIVLAGLSLTAHVLAQDSISGLEFLGVKSDAKIGDVIAALYIYGVGFVALAAFIVFTAGGVRYIFAGDRDPSGAKEWMWNAFWGLVLALTSWLILYTINPKLIENVGDLGLQKIQTSTTSGQPTAGGTATEGAECVSQFGAPLSKTCASPLRCASGAILPGGRHCSVPPGDSRALTSFTTCQKPERLCDAPATPPTQGVFKCRRVGTDQCAVGSAFPNSTCGDTCPGSCVQVADPDAVICPR